MTKKKQLLEFMDKELPSASLKLALERFQDEILHLHNSGYAVHQIQRYLEAIHSLKSSRQSIGLFIKRIKDK